MAKHKKKKVTWMNIKSNLIKRLERAKRKGKSEKYVKDLELAISKRH